MTTRTSRAIRAGLRRIINDPKASLGMRMKAIQLLIGVEGASLSEPSKRAEVKSSSNLRRLRELLAENVGNNAEPGSPGAAASSLSNPR